MRLEIEIPEEWIKSGREWHSHQIMSCSQCTYKTPLPSLFVAHVFNEHGGRVKDPEEETLTLDP